MTPVEPLFRPASRLEAGGSDASIEGSMQSQQHAVSTHTQHSVKVRDLRARFGEPDAFAAQCSCGWTGERREGLTAAREARRDGRVHAESARGTA